MVICMAEDTGTRVRRRAMAAWVVLLPLVLGAMLLASMNAVFGILTAAVVTPLGYVATVRPVFRGDRDALPVRVRYLLGAVALLVAPIGATEAVLLVAGTEGVGSIDHQEKHIGSHNTPYWQCFVKEPDGTVEQLPYTSPCPKPDGAKATLVYFPGSAGTSWGPLIGTKSSLRAKASVAVTGDLAALALLVSCAVATARHPRPGGGARAPGNGVVGDAT